MPITKKHNGVDHTLVRVTDSNGGGWPKGTLGWLEVNTDIVWDGNFFYHWHHELGKHCEIVEEEENPKKIEYLKVDPARNHTFVSVWWQYENG
jgi:hypothetical protein